MKASVKISAALVAVLILAGLAAYRWGDWGAASPQSTSAQQATKGGNGAGRSRPAAAPPVVVAAVSEQADTTLIEVTGSGLALRSAILRPAAAGEVKMLAFKAGQRVQTGQVLLRLDDRNQRLDVDAAANQLDAARRLMARYDITAGSGAVPDSEVDTARTAVTTARITLDQARAALADRVLLAPFTGITGLAEVQAGDRVGTDSVLTTLDDRSTLRVAFAVPELHIARLAVGQDLSLSHRAFPGRVFKGRITQIDSRIDTATRTVRVEAQVPNGDDVLRAGMAFQLRLKLDGERVQAVPELAVQWGRDGAYVWAVRGQDSRAEQVPVQILRRVQGRVLLRPQDPTAKPLRTGEQVVVEGVQRLRQGRAVAIISTLPDVAAVAAAASGVSASAPVTAPVTAPLTAPATAPASASAPSTGSRP